jgi:hypothetical protein
LNLVIHHIFIRSCFTFSFFNSGSLLLESKIQTETAYQKQQETLIVWSEGDNFDLALSFQEKAGCDEIWEKICQVLRIGTSFFKLRSDCLRF